MWNGYKEHGFTSVFFCWNKKKDLVKFEELVLEYVTKHKIHYKGVVNMSIEDTLLGASNAYTFQYALLNAVAREIGMERTAALNTKMCETMGAMQGKMLKEQVDIEEFDAEVAYSACKKFMEGLGIGAEVMETSPQKIVFKVGRCPVYEAAQMMGLSSEDIECHCSTSSLKFMDAMVKQLNPNLSYHLTRFRSGSDDCCEEEIVLG